MISKKRLAAIAAEDAKPVAERELAKSLRKKGMAPKGALPKTEKKLRFLKPCIRCGAKRGMGELKRVRTKADGRKVSQWQCVTPCAESVKR